MTGEWDEDYEDYASLCDEMNDIGSGPWVENDWEPRAVANGKRYAEKHGLPWPPREGDYDRLYDREQNPEDYTNF